MPPASSRRAAVRVTLIDRHNYHLFQPLLYQVATASLSPGDVASPIRWVLRRQQNVTRAARRGAAHRSGARKSSSSIPADLKAAWKRRSPTTTCRRDRCRARVFRAPEWAARAPGLKTLDDALEIRRQVLLAFEAAERETDESVRRRLLTFVIVGGGPTGVELAGALAEIARQSLRKDFRTHPTGVGAHPAARRRTARARDVSPRSCASGPVPRSSDWASRCAPARSSRPSMHEGVKIGDERIAAQTVLWAAGVAASPLVDVARRAARSRRPRARRADPDGSRPSRDVFVVGDVCALQQDGQLAARRRAGGDSGGQRMPRATSCARCAASRSTPFRYRNYGNMAVIGRGAAVADIGPAKGVGLLRLADSGYSSTSSRSLASATASP